jgi:hypothetical protein
VVSVNRSIARTMRMWRGVTKEKGGPAAFFPHGMRCYFFMFLVAVSSIVRAGFVVSGQ